MDRRRFLFLFGGSTAALVLAGQGALALPQRMALLASGQCSFCLGSSGVRSLAGMLGKPARLCDLCVTWLHALDDGHVRVPSPQVITSADPGRPISAFLSARTRREADAAELRRLLGGAKEPAVRARIDEAISGAIARSPVDFGVRLRAGDLLFRANVADAAAAQYSLVASAYRHQGFYLKTVAVYKQVERLLPAPHPGVRHELADLYEVLGLSSDCASLRRNTNGGPVAACSFCEVGRELAPSFTVLGERICQPCVSEAAALFESHRAA